LKVVTEEAVRMSDGKLFDAVGPATGRLVVGSLTSPESVK